MSRKSKLMTQTQFDALCAWLNQRIQFSETPDGEFNISGCAGDLQMTRRETVQTRFS